jgi:hypothetical protein
MTHKVEILKDTQLGAIEAKFFIENYRIKGFTDGEFADIYKKVGGNTWLMLNIANSFDDIFDNKEDFLADFNQYEAFNTYQNNYLVKLFELLNDAATNLLCHAVFEYTSFSISDFQHLKEGFKRY